MAQGANFWLCMGIYVHTYTGWGRGRGNRHRDRQGQRAQLLSFENLPWPHDLRSYRQLLHDRVRVYRVQGPRFNLQYLKETNKQINPKPLSKVFPSSPVLHTDFPVFQGQKPTKNNSNGILFRISSRRRKNSTELFLDLHVHNSWCFLLEHTHTPHTLPTPHEKQA